MKLRSVYYKLPVRMRYLVRRLYYWPADTLNGVLGRRHKYEPPKGKIFIGSGDFIAQGLHQLELLKRHAELRPDHCVLDVGSGIGRTAVALTAYLSDQGTYHGFDIVRAGVEWCKEKITPDYPNFSFQLVDLYNDLYTKNQNSAKDFIFPYADEQFDVVFLFSVFTHMLPDEIDNYLGQINRVLKPNGCCLATFFTYNTDTETTISQSGHGFYFPENRGGYRLMSNQVKSANVALSEALLGQIISNNGMYIIEQVDGYWKTDNSGKNDFQDIIVFSKE